MKIELPENSPKKSVNNTNTTKDVSNKTRYNKHKTKEDKEVKENPKKEIDLVEETSEISWRERDGFATAIINRKLIKIDLKKFDIYLPNGFKIGNNKTLEGAKEKSIKFFS